jgi:hypothetical protein
MGAGAYAFDLLLPRKIWRRIKIFTSTGIQGDCLPPVAAPEYGPVIAFCRCAAATDSP